LKRTKDGRFIASSPGQLAPREGLAEGTDSVIESLVLTLYRPMVFAEKLWIVVAVGALIGLAIVIWRAQIKRRKQFKNSRTL
jgi:hypothetical protein